MPHGGFKQLFFYDYFLRKSKKEQAKVAKVGKRKDQDEESNGNANDVNEKDEGTNEDEDDSDEDEAEILKVTNCPIHASCS